MYFGFSGVVLVEDVGSDMEEDLTLHYNNLESDDGMITLPLSARQSE